MLRTIFKQDSFDLAKKEKRVRRRLLSVRGRVVVVSLQGTAAVLPLVFLDLLYLDAQALVPRVDCGFAACATGREFRASSS